MMTSSLQLLIKERQGQTFLVHCCFYFIPVMFDSFLFFRYGLCCGYYSQRRDELYVKICNELYKQQRPFVQRDQTDRERFTLHETHTHSPHPAFSHLPSLFSNLRTYRGHKEKNKKNNTKTEGFFYAGIL